MTAGGGAVIAGVLLFGEKETVEVPFPRCGTDLPRVGMTVAVIGRPVMISPLIGEGRHLNLTTTSDLELLLPQQTLLN